MIERPKLKIALTIPDVIIEIIGWISILVVWGFTLINFQRLPNIIPIHFNGASVADRFGDKWLILTLPFIATVLFIGLTILNKFPQTFNYLTEINKDNALNQYTNAARLIRNLKGIIVINFGLISYQTIRHANGDIDGIGIWVLPLTIGLIFT